MKKSIIALICFLLFVGTIGQCCPEGLGNSGEEIILPEAALHFNITFRDLTRSILFSHENPGESSLTRVYFLVKAKE